MSRIEINYKLDDDNDQNLFISNKKLNLQKNNWEKTKILISKNIKDIFWKAWIKPLKFEK